MRHVHPDLSDRIDRRRGELVELINNWVSTHIQPSTNSTEHVGRAVDDLAAAYVAAELVLQTAKNAAEPAVHDAWSEASTLAVAWADLVADVVDGQPPIPWPIEHIPPN
ncbi:hypothetical protein [Nocardia sp. NBC_00403]|uniref:hypothetical protein n=1 Tax=Nocardia sp. NBC_00403 TaxID=2975990 RepID=UPI002E2050DC